MLGTDSAMPTLALGHTDIDKKPVSGDNARL